MQFDYTNVTRNQIAVQALEQLARLRCCAGQPLRALRHFSPPQLDFDVVVENDYQQNLFSVARLFKDVMPLSMMFNQCQECAARSRYVSIITTTPKVNEVRPSAFD